jgi:hypothetical protein
MSCLSRILVPPEKILVSLKALHRDRGLRVAGMVVLGIFIVAAVVAGIYSQSKKEQLLIDLPATVRDQIDKTRQYIGTVKNNVRNNGGDPEEDAKLRDLQDLLAALQAQPQEKEEAVQVDFSETVHVLGDVGAEHQTDMTGVWLAGARAALAVETFQYVFIACGGAVFLLMLLLSARISTHRHRIIAHEKQTHSTIISR